MFKKFVFVVFSATLLLAVLAQSGVEMGGEDFATYSARVRAEKAQETTVEQTEKRSDARYRSDAIQFCKDSLFERYRPTGGVSFNMGETVYLPKGYGALIVGNGVANSGLIRFKCTFKDRILTEIQVTGR